MTDILYWVEAAHFLIDFLVRYLLCIKGIIEENRSNIDNIQCIKIDSLDLVFILAFFNKIYVLKVNLNSEGK